jgi:hypothetical protein
MCVQDFDAQCVLQFTLVNAAGCALHRHASLVIHRIEWSFIPSRQAHACTRPIARSSHPSNRGLGICGQPPVQLFKPRHAMRFSAADCLSGQVPTLDLHGQIGFAGDRRMQVRFIEPTQRHPPQ